jgi:hypothetical protein
VLLSIHDGILKHFRGLAFLRFDVEDDRYVQLICYQSSDVDMESFPRAKHRQGPALVATTIMKKIF